MRSLPSGWNTLLAQLGFKRRQKRAHHNPSLRRLRIESLERRQMLSITVNTALDFTDGSITDGSVSLRDAISLAPAEDVIDFAPSLNGAVIVLDDVLGEIDFDKSLTIDASTLASGLTIDASAADLTPNSTRVDGNSSNDGDGIRIFNITDPSFGAAPPTVTLKGQEKGTGPYSINRPAPFSFPSWLPQMLSTLYCVE